MQKRFHAVLMAAAIVSHVVSAAHAQTPGQVKWLSVATDKPALLFAPGDAVSVTLRVKAGAAKTMTWVAVDQKERELQRGPAPVVVSADAATELTVDMGKPEEGFYVIRLTLWDGPRQVDRTSVPVAVFGPPPAADESLKEPIFPVGVYDKYIINRDRVISNTYLHAICRTLRQAGLNCMTSGNTLLPPTVEQLDIAASWGVRAMIRTDMCTDPKALNHPNVLALMYGDEPKVENLEQYKKQYDLMKATYPEKTLLTCMVGDSLGARGGHDPAVVWNTLQPAVRFVRFYPIRRDHYDLTHRRLAASTLPANAVFQLIDSYADTPWWFVSQTFGMVATEIRPETFWGNPTAAELRGLTHLSLAHGAKGLLGWAFQTHWQSGGRDVPCLVKQDTLAPEDDKWATWIEVAKFATRFKSILLDAKRGGCELAADRGELELVARQTSDGRRFAYIVNTDTRSTIESDVWVFSAQLLGFRDLVEERDLPLKPGKWDRILARVKLGPGEGRLYEVTVMTGPISADRINTSELLPIMSDPIEPIGPDEHERFKQVQALPAWWRFAEDKEDAGQKDKWFAADFDDSGWGFLRVGSFWNIQGVKLAPGQGWYRTRFTPEQAALDSKPIKLLFMAADESAWVYLNGELICTHYPDNTDGWDRSFAIDVTGKLKAGVPNVLAVRVLNRTAAGGIYGKVALVKPIDGEKP